MHTLTLIHNNGDKRQVSIRCGIYWQVWKKARKILVVVWGDLGGELALDVEKNILFNFGPGGGICRRDLLWKAVDEKEAYSLWCRLTENGRKQK